MILIITRSSRMNDLVHCTDLEENITNLNHLAMNSLILVCMFVFTISTLAAKIPTDVDKSEALEANAESLVKENLDFSDPSQDTSLITKRGVGKSGSCFT